VATANNGAGVSVNHTYAGSGAYRVALAATDAYGAVSPVAVAVVVLGTPGADTITVCGND